MSTGEISQASGILQAVNSALASAIKLCSYIFKMRKHLVVSHNIRIEYNFAWIFREVRASVSLLFFIAFGAGDAAAAVAIHSNID